MALRSYKGMVFGWLGSGSATHGFWLENEKGVSQVIGEDQSRLPGREMVGEAKRGGR